MRSKAQGFTLMELMITVAIVGILAAIAWPSYQQYVIRNNRVAVQAELMQIAAAAERYRSQQLTYTNSTLAKLYGSTTYPKAGQALYTITYTVDPDTGLTWVAMAVPTTGGLQAKVNDGALAINSAGQRCWKKGALSCTLTGSTPDPDWSTAQ